MVWCPNGGHECNARIIPRPKTAFIITDYKEDKSEELQKIENEIKRILKKNGFEVEYAKDIRKGKNVLCKICDAMQSVGLGIVLYSKESPRKSIPNIFFEAAIMYSLGKEVIMIGHNVRRPSDLDGIEWIHVEDADSLRGQLSTRIKQWITQSKYYLTLGEIEKNAMNFSVAAEYYKKSTLIDQNEDAISRLKRLQDEIKTVNGHRKLDDSIETFVRLLPNESNITKPPKKRNNTPGERKRTKKILRYKRMDKLD